ncbi:hypothetical protein [Lacrimispora sp.]|uniref:hypothetical protein n=1 Tax=Lacrimispora sp. TaxID=2719234 RepID=UPI0028ABC676|nr:hypothetical protein [Lacrimispora sp.]
MLMDLSGIWDVWIMPQEKGQELVTRSFIEGKDLPPERPRRDADGPITLPGILQGQGYGDEIQKDTPWVSGLHDPFWYEREEYQFGQEKEVLVPFLSQPPRHFIGLAWYEREILIPEDTEEEIYLHIELTRWRSHVWVNGEYQGSDCSLCTAHEINLGRLKKGSHRLTVLVDNRFQYPYRPDGHGVSDALGASWNGMAGKIVLLSGTEVKKWEIDQKEYAASHQRTMEVADGMILVDGRPEYFRGTHFGGDYPLTGYPYTDLEWWRNLMKKVKDWGFNFIRCHSLCPPEAAFVAADEEGIYLQPECGMWNVFNEGIPMLEVLMEETRRILKQFGHHPSFALFSPTNEPSGQWYGPLRQWVKETRGFDESLGYGGRRLYTAQSGWFYDVPPKDITGTDYIYFHRSAYGPILGGNIRNHEGFKGKDYGPSLEGATLPVISHEMGQWCAYPDFSVIDKFTGYLKPGNYQVFQENARTKGLLELNQAFVRCSGKNQVMMYKEEFEANLRTPHLYGYEMLDLHDYMGQGTALVGVLDPFWENKGYATPEEFRKFNSETVILARISSYVIKSTEPVTILVELCHFGKEDITKGIVRWKLEKEGMERGFEVIEQGEFQEITVSAGKNLSVGTLNLDLSYITEHSKLKLTIFLDEIENSWPLYVYVKKEETPKETVLYTRKWEEAKEALLSGGRVVYSPYLSDLDFDCPPLSIRPVFWNSQMGPGWCRSLGLMMNSNHPIFRLFPTEEHGGWQWEDILSNSRGFLLDGMPKGFEPIIRGIDDWNRNLSLGLLMEGKVGDGKLLLVTACLEGSFEKRPEAYSLKEALLSYAASDEFQPQTQLSLSSIEKHLFPNHRMKALHAKYIPEQGAIVHGLDALKEENPNTSVWIENENYPISLDICVDESVLITGLLMVTDQKDRMHQGCVKDYTIEVERDGVFEEIARGQFMSSFMTQKVEFDKEVTTKVLRFTALSGYGAGERMEWEEREDGWYQKKGEGKAAIQAAGFHLILDQQVEGNDITYWNENRKSRTKEIEE